MDNIAHQSTAATAAAQETARHEQLYADACAVLAAAREVHAALLYEPRAYDVPACDAYAVKYAAITAQLLDASAAVEQAKAALDVARLAEAGLGRSPRWRMLLLARGATANAAVALARHPAWENVLAFDELWDDAVLLKEPPHRAFEDAPGPYPRRWTFEDTTRTIGWLGTVECATSPRAVKSVVYAEAKKTRRHAPREWLDSLPPHDGVERVSATLGPGGLRMLVSLVARAYSPGCDLGPTPVLQVELSTLRSLMFDDRWLGTFAPRGRDAGEFFKGRWLYVIPAKAPWPAAPCAAHCGFVTLQAPPATEPMSTLDIVALRPLLFAEALAAFKAGMSILNPSPDEVAGVVEGDPAATQRRLWAARLAPFLTAAGPGGVTADDALAFLGVAASDETRKRVARALAEHCSYRPRKCRIPRADQQPDGPAFAYRYQHQPELL